MVFDMVSVEVSLHVGCLLCTTTAASRMSSNACRAGSRAAVVQGTTRRSSLQSAAAAGEPGRILVMQPTLLDPIPGPAFFTL
jgi:hypothetical protein